MENIKSFLTHDKVLDYLELEIENLLRQNEIFTLSSYAFKNVDEEDPKHSGLVRWFTKSRIEILKAGPYETVINERPTDEEVKLMSCGMDIQGIFDLCWLSMGHLLLVHSGRSGVSKTKTFMNEPLLINATNNNLFWLHYNNTMINLSMLSDRIRDYLLIALSVSGKDVDFLKNTSYAKAYQDIKKIISPNTYSKINLPMKFDELKSLAVKVGKYRKDRNSIIHELASAEGKLERSFMSSLQEADHNRVITFQPESELGKPKSKSASDIPPEEIITECKIWYRDLVSLANVGFEIEYLLR